MPPVAGRIYKTRSDGGKNSKSSVKAEECRMNQSLNVNQY
jgi:hypothetical protein